MLRAICPAKINFGLEVVGRRPDGYHDLVTIFQTLSLADRLSVDAAPDLRLTCSEPALATPDNLCLSAAAALRAATGVQAGAHLHLEKRIPVAAGLGGGSSDAAAALRLLNDLWGTGLSLAELATLAAGLGADVPFFLHGPAALATGTGNQLESLPPPPPVWVVLVRPDLDLPGKTARLYRALTPDDWTDGARTHAQAARLRAGAGLDTAQLVNAFARPLLAEFPPVAAAETALRAAGATEVFPAGSGPTLVALCGDVAMAETIATTVRGPDRAVLVARTMTAADGPPASSGG
jgi:4-diphosphocytidyl-2-C-methyl-D-erythritol kinase